LSISKKQWTRLLNYLPLKLVTPLPIIITTLAPHRTGHPEHSSRLGRCAPGKTVYYNNEIHYQRIINNAILQFSLFLYFQCLLKCKATAQSMFLWLFYNTVLMHVLSFGSSLEIFSCLVWGVRAVSSLQTSKPYEGSKEQKLFKGASGNLSS